MVVDCVVVVVEEVIVDAGGCKTPTRLADDGTAQQGVGAEVDKVGLAVVDVATSVPV